MEDIGELLQMDAGLAQMLAAHDVRKQATKWSSDRCFVELWDRFFAWEYGPIARVA